MHEKLHKNSKDEANIQVYLGAYNISSDLESDFGREEFSVKEIIIHDGWNPKTVSHAHDIALIRLSSKVQFNAFISPICLMTTSNMLKHGKIAGWGVYDDAGEYSDIAKVAELNTFNVTYCLTKEKKLVHVFWLESFCADSSNQGVCKGDSGSGLYFDIGGKKYLKGIVSSTLYGKRCTENTIALYSDVSKYFEFIKVK